MQRSTVQLPNGSTFTVSPIYGGVIFKSNDQGASLHALPSGWSIIITTEKSVEGSSSSPRSPPPFSLERGDPSPNRSSNSPSSRSSTPRSGMGEHTRFSKPTINRDSLFISSLSLPSSFEYKPADSPTRQIALMLWATLYWYFHLDEPDSHVLTRQCSLTPISGRPKADWRIYIKREGILKGRNLMPKLERMGLIASEDSCVGLNGAYGDMFVSRRSFWQLDPRIFLFTLRPTHIGLVSSAQQTPPLQPVLKEGHSRHAGILADSSSSPASPYYSSSYLPTYFPPPPTQYTFTNEVRHPIRPKPPRQGEVFYTRYIPSLGQTLSFRVPHLPTSYTPLLYGIQGRHRKSSSVTSLPDTSLTDIERGQENDLETLHRWMNNPRVNSAWGLGGSTSTQERFLQRQMMDRHLFPCYGCYDDIPFGYFEIYWLKEDKLGRSLPGSVDNWDRGIRALVGEEHCTGSHRMQVWLSALVHYCWLSDSRTQNIVSEPRVDNAKFIDYLQQAGFYKEGEITLPQKQCALMKIKRENWECPTI